MSLSQAIKVFLGQIGVCPLVSVLPVKTPYPWFGNFIVDSVLTYSGSAGRRLCSKNSGAATLPMKQKFKLLDTYTDQEIVRISAINWRGVSDLLRSSNSAHSADVSELT